jgi:hypothetical protein
LNWFEFEFWFEFDLKSIEKIKIKDIRKSREKGKRNSAQPGRAEREMSLNISYN